MGLRRQGRAGHLLALAVIALMLQGCAVGRYFQYRVQDALDIVEAGVTVSTTPQIALYWNSLDLAVAGYSDFDGYLIGWGGRHVGFTKLHNKCYGLIVSREEVAWGDYKENPQLLHKRYGGLAGLPGLIGGVVQDGHPLDSPACVHFFPHLGYVGIVWNLRWGEILDFVVGWTTIDLNQDDGPSAKSPEPKEENAALEPKGNSASAEPMTQRIHVVQGGDTLFGISRKYYGTSAKWRDILDANRSVVSDENKLQPGMKLVIPGK